MNFHEAFDSPTADVIVRSSDGVHFRVHRLILSEASPVFADMFTLPKRSTDTKVLPVVQLSEDGETLEGLLRVCYPTKGMRFTDLGLLRKVMVAVEKYMAGDALETLGEALMNHTLLEREPVRAYALACQFRLRGAAVAAAKASLKHSLSVSPSPELEEASAQAYNDLMRYRVQCIAVIDRWSMEAVMTDTSVWAGAQYRNLTCYGCTCNEWYKHIYLPCIKSILQDHVSGAALMAHESLLAIFQHSSRAGSIPKCVWKNKKTVLELQLRLAVMIDREIAGITFKPSW